MKNLLVRKIVSIATLFLSSLIIFNLFTHHQRRKTTIETITSKTVSKGESIFDNYDLSTIEKVELWSDGKHNDLFNLEGNQLSDFISFKNEQYNKRREHIAQQCKFVRSAAEHMSRKSTRCQAESKSKIS